ncbi:hypothetical protein [Viridibacillus arvi]|uniref:hypothetical protein n=1 Tax=Viridibacillus arvi TaxID=263475 RepID=UPI003D288852
MERSADYRFAFKSKYPKIADKAILYEIIWVYFIIFYALWCIRELFFEIAE